jgi:hypothetical protein
MLWVHSPWSGEAIDYGEQRKNHLQFDAHLELPCGEQFRGRERYRLSSDMLDIVSVRMTVDTSSEENDNEVCMTPAQ